MSQPKTILALDVGTKRIGIALANLVARLPSPQGVIINDDKVIQNISDLIVKNDIMAVVVGLPRSLNGQETKQTQIVKDFAKRLGKELDVQIYMQDEALTSKHAEAELEKNKSLYNKETIDALSAVYILEDFLTEHRELKE